MDNRNKHTKGFSLQNNKHFKCSNTTPSKFSWSKPKSLKMGTLQPIVVGISLIYVLDHIFHQQTRLRVSKSQRTRRLIGLEIRIMMICREFMLFPSQNRHSWMSISKYRRSWPRGIIDTLVRNRTFSISLIFHLDALCSKHMEPSFITG